MKVFSNETEVKGAISGIVDLSKDGMSVEIKNKEKLVFVLIDDLVWSAVFSPSENVKNMCRYIIRLIAKKLGLGPASVYEIYAARGKGEFNGLTVPAINLRGLTYDSARAVFRAAKKLDAPLLLLEIARSEIGYTDQRPAEYTAVVLGAAIKEQYPFPVFIQGDHFQINSKRFAENPEKEIKGAQDIIKEAIEAGFYNIDIDTSTLVDLSKPTIKEQQETNFKVAADVTKYIRGLEPKSITVSLGGEIGEIGGKNSTEEELRTYLNGYFETAGKITGVIKVAVQTGTTHGGIPLADGKIASVKLDFDTLEKLGKVALKEFKLAGCVQHGASTLPAELFDKFPKVETAEIHLATEFQNMVMDHKQFPESLRNEINAYCSKELSAERKPTDTDQQFYYKARKKANGPFKKQIWSISDAARKVIGDELQAKFESLFEKLNIRGSSKLVKKYGKVVDVPVKMPGGGVKEAFEGAD